MKVLPMIRKMVSNYNYEREAKFLDKYCKLDNNLSREVSAQLYPARKGIANYAKSKGVTVTITDAEKKVAGEVFEFDIDERQLQRASEGKLNIIITQETPAKKGVVQSVTGFVPNDTKATNVHRVPDYFVVEDAQEGIQWTRLTSHEYEDNFLRMVYRKIGSLTEKLAKKS